MRTATLVIINRLGLHARAAAKLVKTASRFESSVELIRDKQRVNAKSIMGVMMLAASQGVELSVDVDGPDETEALDAVQALVADRFGEPE